MKNKRYYFLLLLFILAIPVFITGCRIESVEEHNKRLENASQNKSEILSSLLESSKLNLSDTASSAKVSSAEQLTTVPNEATTPKNENLYHSPESVGDTVVHTHSDVTPVVTDKFSDSENVIEKTNTPDTNDTTRKTISAKPDKGTSELATKKTSEKFEKKTTKSEYTPKYEKNTAFSESNTTDKYTTEKNTSQKNTTQKSTTTVSQQTTTAADYEDEYILVHLTVTCSKVLNDSSLNTTAKLPDDGIFIDTYLAVKKECTVFSALQDALAEKNISLGYNYSPLYNTHYIYEIGGLSEKECGKYSGWKYFVNNVTPGTGCGNYKLSDGDNIVFGYVAGYNDTY